MPQCARTLTVSLLMIAALVAAAQPPGTPSGPQTSPAAPATPMNPMNKSALPTPPPMKYEPPTQIAGEDLDAWIKKLDLKVCRDPAVRELAVRTVPLFGPPAVKALPKIIERMGDPDYAVRLAALLVVTTNPITEEKLQKQILNRLITGQDGIPGLIRHEQAGMRLPAVRALIRIGPPAAAAIPVLTQDYHLKNSYSYEARQAAAEALGQIARGDAKANTPPDTRAIIALIRALPEENCLVVRIEIVQSLIFLGAPADPKDQAAEKKILLDRIKTEPDHVLKLWLRVCLMRLDPALINNENLEPISSALSSNDQRTRVNAAEAFTMMGPGASKKAGALSEGLKFAKSTKEEDLFFLFRCLEAIGAMGKEASFMKEEIRPLITQHPSDAIKAIAKDTVDKLEGKKPDK